MRHSSVWRVGYQPRTGPQPSLMLYLDVSALNLIDAIQVAVLQLGPKHQISGVVRKDDLWDWISATSTSTSDPPRP